MRNPVERLILGVISRCISSWYLRTVSQALVTETEGRVFLLPDTRSLCRLLFSLPSPRHMQLSVLDMFVTVFPAADYRIKPCTNKVRGVKLQVFSFWTIIFELSPVIGCEIVILEVSDLRSAAIYHLFL